MASADKTVRVAIVGCGQIADAHLQELGKLDDATVVATCDRYRDLAMQAAQRFGVLRYYDDLSEMVQRERPDIVHIATPAQTHGDLAKQLLSFGINVYIEKPLTLDESELRDVLATARAHNCVVCAGHDQLFDPAWLELRRRVEAGEIGDVVHVESVLGYALSGQFGSLVNADAHHWVRQLPGGLFHNTISHPLYRITEFLRDERPAVVANWWSKPGFTFPTELFVHVRGEETTGVLVFSTSIAPQRLTRVYGTKGTLEIDLDAQSVTRIALATLPGAFGKIDAPWRRKREHARALWRNVRRFLRSDIHYFAGMGSLFQHFQNAVRDPGSKWPVSGEEMIRVTRIMDEIFAACRAAARNDAISARDTSRGTTRPLTVAGKA